MSIMELIERGKRARKQKERKKFLQNVALGAAVGVTVGAVAGVLLAPKSGKETREDVVKAVKGLPGKAKEGIEAVKEKVEEVKKSVTEKAEDIKKSVTEKAEDIKKDVTEKAGEKIEEAKTVTTKNTAVDK